MSLKNLLLILNIILVFLGIFLYTGCKSQLKIVTTATKSQITETTEITDTTTHTSLNTKIDSLKAGYPVYRHLQGKTYQSIKVDSVPEILARVFPRVVFIETRLVTLNAKSTFGACFNGEIYYPVNSFNQLIALATNDKISLEEKIEAFIFLYEGMEGELELISLEDYNGFDSEYCNPNLKVETRNNGQEIIYYIQTDELNQIVFIIKQWGIAKTECIRINKAEKEQPDKNDTINQIRESLLDTYDGNHNLYKQLKEGKVEGKL